MNNKIYFIIALLMIIFPMNVFAFDFTCDSGTYSNGDKFNCLISQCYDIIEKYDSNIFTEILNKLKNRAYAKM